MCSSLLCPCCYSDTFDSMHIRPPPAIVVSLLKELVLPCNKGCGKMVRLERYITHADDKCQGHYESTDSPSKMTMSEVLLRPSNVPVTPAERKVAGHLVKKILHHQSEPQGVLKVPTSGQVCIKSHCITVVKVMIILCLLYNLAHYLDASDWLAKETSCWSWVDGRTGSRVHPRPLNEAGENPPGLCQ